MNAKSLCLVITIFSSTKNYFIYKVDVDVVDNDSLLTSGALSLKGHSKI